MARSTANQYAEAVYFQAEDPFAFFKEMTLWKEIMDKAPELVSFLSGPSQTLHKEKIISKALKGFSTQFLNFFLLLLKRGRVNVYDDICRSYETIMNEKEGRWTGTITIASPALKGIYRSGKGVIHEKVDPSLIGGLIFKAADRQLDLSIKNRLIQLKRMLSP